jgi:tRNA(Arg) A34 adenosine deaminase TadA
MDLAISQAEKSYPYGAVLIKEGKIVAQAASGDKIDPTAHAEIKVLRQACKILKTKSISGAIIYTTCEPCAMCFSAAWWAGVSKIVYGITLKDSEKIKKGELLISSGYLNENSGNRLQLVKGILKDKILGRAQE